MIHIYIVLVPNLLNLQRPGTRTCKTGVEYHPGGNPGANFQSIFHRCYLREVALEWELTKEIIYLPLSCLQSEDRCVGQVRDGALHEEEFDHEVVVTLKLSTIRLYNRGCGTHLKRPGTKLVKFTKSWYKQL